MLFLFLLCARFLTPKNIREKCFEIEFDERHLVSRLVSFSISSAKIFVRFVYLKFKLFRNYKLFQERYRNYEVIEMQQISFSNWIWDNWTYKYSTHFALISVYTYRIYLIYIGIVYLFKVKNCEKKCCLKILR